MSPAEVSKVIILDADKKSALAIVPDSQFSLAIGKQGQNVRLAARLCGWNIDIKSHSKYEELEKAAKNEQEDVKISEEDAETNDITEA